MPRRPDPWLETRILEAARKLWAKGGEKALSMRSVAKSAGTTTPTIYHRFHNRQDILISLLRSTQQELFQELERSRTPEQFATKYLEFAMRRPHEYELFHVDWAGRRTALQRSKPSIELLHARVSEWLGVPKKECRNLMLALWSLLHGTALLLTSRTVEGRAGEELRRACVGAVTTLVGGRGYPRTR
jgi:AcrR family transcriptional regulator